MRKSNNKKILLVLACVFVVLVFTLESLNAQQSQPKEDNPEAIVKNTLKWVSEHLVSYRFSETYELGGDLISHGRPPEDAMALRCFDVPPSNAVYLYTSQYGRADLYDTSLAIILLSLNGQYEEARNLLLTLQHLQNSDGSIGFSWNTMDDNFYNRSYIRTGALAWAGGEVYFLLLSGNKTKHSFVLTLWKSILIVMSVTSVVIRLTQAIIKTTLCLIGRK